MRELRKLLSFAAIGLLLAFGMALFCGALTADCLSVLTSGHGTARYLRAAAAGQRVCAVSRTADSFVLVWGTTDGKQTGTQQVTLPSAAADCTVAGLYPESDDAALLAVYEPENGAAAKNLGIYRITAAGQTERLLLQPCSGSTAAERMTTTRLLGFYPENDSCGFAVRDGETAQQYSCGTSGLETGENRAVGSAQCAVILSDGTIAAGGAQLLTLNEQPTAFSLDGQTVAALSRQNAGFLYLDGTALRVYFSDRSGTSATELYTLPHDMEELTDICLTDNGALLLRDGNTLELVGASGTTALTKLLYRGVGKCVGILLGIVIGWLLLTVVVWYLLCGRRRSYMPLALRSGGLLALCALLIGTTMRIQVIEPVIRQSAERELQGILTNAAVLAEQASEDDLAARIAAELTGADSSCDRVRVSVLRAEDGVWRVQQDSEQLSTGSRAALLNGFSADRAEQTMRDGSTVVQAEDTYYLFLKSGQQLLQIAAQSGTLTERTNTELQNGVHRLWAGIGLLWLTAFLLLLLIGRRLSRISHAMTSLADGHAEQLALHTGDELESLAASYNSMARTMTQSEQARDGLIAAYLRFVPERVLKLLGRDSVLEVDKHTFAARHLAAMMVWFEFPEHVYDNSTRALFDSINEVIECTAAVVVRTGGTVFNFTHNGYDVVLDAAAGQAIRTAVAVQQEVISLNERLARDGMPQVRLRVALDAGEVVIGIVGDETQMQPATISTCFTTARHLIGLCSRVDAGILCTENVIAGAEGYASRYMGKSEQGEELIRVYEVFDGDPLTVRRGKETAGRRFSQGVFALYSHDFSTAKRLFLEIVHENPADGGARYYLYLADRMEKQTDGTISLDS